MIKKLFAVLLLACLPAWAGRGFSGGTTDTIVVPGVGTPVDLFSGPMTISFWMYPTSITTSYPFGKWDATAANEQYLVCVGDTTADGASGACYYVGSFSFINGVFGGGSTLTANHWYNVVVRVDTGSTLCGSPCAKFNVNGTFIGFGAFTERRTAGGLNLKFGCGAGNHPTQCFPGYIAEVAFWNAPLSDGETVALGSCAPVNLTRRTSLVAYYPLYGAASPEPDLSGGRNGGTVTNTTVTPHIPCGRPY